VERSLSSLILGDLPDLVGVRNGAEGLSHLRDVNLREKVRV